MRSHIVTYLVLVDFACGGPLKNGKAPRWDEVPTPPTLGISAERKEQPKHQLNPPFDPDLPKKPEVVKPPDHLDGVPLERDGHLNKNYRKEVILGMNVNNHPLEEFNHLDPNADPNSKQVQEGLEVNRIVDAFQKADKNSDGLLTMQELDQLIADNSLQHLDEAAEENRRAFSFVDKDKDGFATWEEYHFHFLTDKKLMDPSQARNHAENSDGHRDLPFNDQETIEKEREQWNEADYDPKDGRLSELEFLGFRHPEHSKVMLDNMVKDILETLDSNKDGRLSEQEWIVSHDEPASQERAYAEERKKEFVDSIDINKDGFADFEELVQYANPRNRLHALKEAEELVVLADSNKDKMLSLDEAIAHKELFLSSAFVNAAGRMHNEL